MERHGFPKCYAIGMTLCASTLSSIIPPSILVVIAVVSIGTLPAANLVPGLFIAFAFLVFNHFYSVYYGYNPPPPFNLRLVVVTTLAEYRLAALGAPVDARRSDLDVWGIVCLPRVALGT